MPAKYAHRLNFTRQKIKIIIFEEPAKGISVGIAFQGDAPGEFVGGNPQHAVFDFDGDCGIGKSKAAFNVGQGIGAGDHGPRLVGQRGKQDMLAAEGANASLVQLHDDH